MTKDREISSARNPKLWSMRAVSQRTGLSEHTLRAWEKRFGFPDPVRLPSGHRRYTAEQVRLLTFIQSALVRGHRVGDVIRLGEPEILALLGSETGAPVDSPVSGISYLDACIRLDADALSATMRQDAASMGVSRFLGEKLIPFVHAIGDGWHSGALSIRHEHVSSEVIEDVLRELRTPLERGLSGRPVVLGTLPGEQHALGLQIVSLMIVACGVPVRNLGTETPVGEIVSLALDIGAVSVAISITEAGASDAASRDVQRLRNALPHEVSLWIGGAGSHKLHDLPSGVRTADGLDDIEVLVAEARGARNT